MLTVGNQNVRVVLMIVMLLLVAKLFSLYCYVVAHNYIFMDSK